MFGELEITGNVEFQGDIYETDEIIRYVQIIKFKFIEKKLQKGKDVIGIVLRRSQYMISVMLAALESNIAFINIELNMPYDRIEYMIKDSGIKYLVVMEDIGSEFAHYDKIFLNDIENYSFKDKKIGGEESYSNYEIDFENIAYIIYTSGTSGKPKGVEIKRKGIYNLIQGVCNLIPFRKKSRIASFTNSTFDIFILETILAMYAGLIVVMADDNQKDNPKKIVELILKQKIDILQMTPSRLKLIKLIDKEWDCLKNLSQILIGGEQFPEELLPEINKATTATIYNMYGPTETTVWSSICNVSESEYVHLGTPIRNTRLYILNEKKLPISNKEDFGEIYIAGDGLARGYLNNPNLTEKSFCKLKCEPFECIYRTGDLGRYDENGNIKCLGRIDEQVKVRGFRIELSEIDVNIEKIDEVKSSITCFIEEEEILINFYVSDKNVDIRTQIKNFLPSYMLPALYYRVDNVLFTASGKTDRKAMLKKYYEQSNLNIFIKNDDEIEKRVFEIISKSIQSDAAISLENKFYELGIDSLKFVSLIVNLEMEFNIEFSDDKLVNSAFNNVGNLIFYIKELVSTKVGI
ncbi:non-ribosomal peptide synthetase [Anaerosacchariphilus polymeriproducens]|uniref:Amino acid adenylation domain-containing protein n=1 Tax=Anaerosacchariphilus polymeriproducens TaxID=1812858 RepID=A0A371AS42_9FIRM|nr:amino acid adenylation domain-containing protein [Anaerosacchariphilus polymeriproducens]RDU22379.1 amino acid adenylation domain-containing protein [Anaerosacchariphilus polymeriproducens]